MPVPDINALLQSGIAAAKSGEREKARLLLLRVVEADEQNELAWLWLSSVVETDQDRLTCLENVLTINPDNKAAQKGVAKLKGETAESPPLVTSHNHMTVRKEQPAISLASAILHPEKQVQEWEWRDPTPDHQRQEAIGYQTTSSYDDIWTHEVEMCPYCAQALSPEENRCPQCNHLLLTSRYRYATPSSSMHNLWVLLLGLGQIYLILGIFNFITTQQVISAVLPLFLMMVFMGLAAGVYFRQSWAHLSAVILLIVVIVVNIFTLLVPIDLTTFGIEAYDPTISNFVGSLTDGLGVTLRGFSFLTAVVALLFAVFKAGPDFERIQYRQIAIVGKGMSDATEFHTAAKKLADVGMWAAAVLHWQLAAAKDPARTVYQKYLGEAYARLGFRERSLDILQAALQRASNPIHQAELKELIESVKTNNSDNYGK